MIWAKMNPGVSFKIDQLQNLLYDGVCKYLYHYMLIGKFLRGWRSLLLLEAGMT